MKTVFSRQARVDFEDVFDWISADNRTAALAMVQRIEAKVHLLETPGLTSVGRPGATAGTRELIAYPYVIVYRVDESVDEIVVLGIFHGARRRERF